jgi:hypothetical protein
MLADAGGWATEIPADRVARWERDKRDLLSRIEAHTPGLGQSREVEGPQL